MNEDENSSYGLRLRRGESWIKRANEFIEQKDYDCALLLYWIGLSALYDVESSLHGRSENQNATDYALRRQFLEKLQALDVNRLLYDTVWLKCNSLIDAIIKNKFMFVPFWKDQVNPSDESEWKEHLIREEKRALRALTDRDRVALVLNMTLERVYIVRCQLAHGSATYQGSVNREQVRNCSNFLNLVVPEILNVFRANPDEDWGRAPYPPIEAN